MGGVVSNLFQLVLKIPSKLALGAINKDLGVPKVLLGKVLELKPRNQSGAFVVTLVLGASEADGATEKCSGKRSTINSYSAKSFEMILTMLTIVVAIHMRFFGISFRGPCFK